MHKVTEEILETNQWRDGEFARLKVNASKPDDVLWCRMCVPMIYAHWEGFVVSALKILIAYLNGLNLKTDQIPTRLAVLAMGDAYKTLSGKQSFEQRVNFTNKFKLLFDENVKINNKIDTKSNLNKDVLKEICEIYNFDFTKFDSIVSDINRLVSVRNSIAHGENSVVPDYENVEKYILAVNAAIDIFVGEIDFFVKHEKYLLAKQTYPSVTI